MTDTERALISNLALNIMSGTLDTQEIYADAKQMYELSQRSDWTPCAEGQNLPTKNGAYLVTIEEKKTSERWTTTLRFMDGEWLASDRYRILAWMKPAPYNPDHMVNTNKKADQFREPTKMIKDKSDGR